MLLVITVARPPVRLGSAESEVCVYLSPFLLRCEFVLKLIKPNKNY